MDDITVTDLLRLLGDHKNEIGCDGTKIGSHNLKSSVRFEITNPEIDLDLELEALEPDPLPGCGCSSGVVFKVKATYGPRISKERKHD